MHNLDGDHGSLELIGRQFWAWLFCVPYVYPSTENLTQTFFTSVKSGRLPAHLPCNAGLLGAAKGVRISRALPVHPDGATLELLRDAMGRGLARPQRRREAER